MWLSGIRTLSKTRYIRVLFFFNLQFHREMACQKVEGKAAHCTIAHLPHHRICHCQLQHIAWTGLSCRLANMATFINCPSKCELRSIIRFLQTERNNAAEINHRMSWIYGENFMSDGVVREWCRKFKYDQTDVHLKDGHVCR